LKFINAQTPAMQVAHKKVFTYGCKNYVLVLTHYIINCD